MLYEIAGTNVRIAGVVHAFPPEFPKVPQWLIDEHKRCELLVVEHDLHADAAPRSPQGVVSLQSVIDPTIWRRLIDLWGSEDELAQERPWAVVSKLTAKLYPQVAGAEIQLLANSPKEYAFLESFEAFVSTLDGVPAEDYASMIDKAFSNRNTVEEAMLSMHRAWLDLDLSAMYLAANHRDLAPPPALYKAVFITRNHRWVSILKQHLQADKKALVAVGALHLCGERNLLQLLRDEGHVLRQLG